MSRSARITHPAELRPEVLDELLVGQEEAREEFRLLSPAGLRALVERAPTSEPTVSLYLDLCPERRHRDAWRIAFKNMVRDTLAGISARREREAVEKLLADMEAVVEERRPQLGRGIALFATPSRSLWRLVALPLELPECIVVGDRPWVRPLVRLMDENDRFIIALLTRERSRFFLSQLGFVEALAEVTGERLRGLVSDWIPPQEREDLEEELTHREGKALALVLEGICARIPARRILWSAAPSLAPSVLEHLPKAVRERLEGEFTADVHLSPAELAGIVEPLERAAEAREEEAAVRAVDEARPRRGWWGLEETLLAVNEQRVMRLVVQADWAAPGIECPRCRMLAPLPEAEPAAPTCPACGAPARREADIVEEAMARALCQDAELEVVRSDGARQLLAAADRAPVGALGRF